MNDNWLTKLRQKWILLCLLIFVVQLNGVLGFGWAGSMDKTIRSVGMLAIVVGVLLSSFLLLLLIRFSGSAAASQLVGFLAACVAGDLFRQAQLGVPGAWWLFFLSVLLALAWSGFAIYRLWQIVHAQ